MSLKRCFYQSVEYLVLFPVLVSKYNLFTDSKNVATTLLKRVIQSTTTPEKPNCLNKTTSSNPELHAVFLDSLQSVERTLAKALNNAKNRGQLNVEKVLQDLCSEIEEVRKLLR